VKSRRLVKETEELHFSNKTTKTKQIYKLIRRRIEADQMIKGDTP